MIKGVTSISKFGRTMLLVSYRKKRGKLLGFYTESCLQGFLKEAIRIGWQDILLPQPIPMGGRKGGREMGRGKWLAAATRTQPHPHSFLGHQFPILCPLYTLPTSRNRSLLPKCSEIREFSGKCIHDRIAVSSLVAFEF